MNVVLGNLPGNLLKDSPDAVTKPVIMYTLIGLFMAAAFFNNAALKDYSNGFNEILFSTPLSKRGFYFGRFLGALVISAVPFLGVFLGVLLGSVIGPLSGEVDASQFGGLSLMTIVIDYVMFIFPNMFIGGGQSYLL